MDNIKLPTSYQRKINNSSSTFNIFNDNHYLKALNSHQDNGHYTQGNNHLQLCVIATQITYKRNNLFHLLKYEKNTTKILFIYKIYGLILI